jgi:SAM-dependent methyltransferase
MFNPRDEARSRLRSLAFMSPRDIGLFLRSARTDALIAQTRELSGNASAFEAAYAGGDPWASGDPRYFYQRRKYEILLRLLPDTWYARVLDLGCGLGHFTRCLAARSDEVIGVDIAQSAVDQAGKLHADIPNLHFLQGDILALPSLPDSGFDLIILADTMYYLPPPIEDRILKELARRTARLLRPGGLLLLCNHFFFSADRDSRLSRRIHDAFSWSSDLDLQKTYRRPFYLVSLLREMREDHASLMPGGRR